MTVFGKIYYKYRAVEGSYSNDADDLGGETWCGIARKKNPQWRGWAIIDAYKSKYGEVTQFVAALKNDSALELAVFAFFKEEYYLPIGGDLLDPLIADELYDIAINCGVETAVKYFQRALNILNRNERFYADIKDDGKFGSATMGAYLPCVAQNGVRLLFNVLNSYQAMHYIRAMEVRSVNEKYIGWFRRIEILKY